MPRTRAVTADVESDFEAHVGVGNVPGLPGAHSQGATVDELQRNLRAVVGLIQAEARERGE
ncbi:MAG: type II toxin-antitoxin system HicB family antitoxin [Actinobacteria bacterium]|nr:type II toxin-antitoxin system HicB family antitoxin [Actinomycetota bacterium]